MKISWGTGIAIVYGAFMVIMITFVISARGVDHSLVMENYYEEDLAYQSHLNKLENARSLPRDLEIAEDASSGHLRFRFPQELGQVNGEVWLYRPSDTSKDLRVPILTDRSNVMTVPTKDLLRGKWRVKVDWQSAGKTYYKEQEVFIQ